jgi:hypothetical protein
MKIGILTFHRAENFGAVLQAYALQEYLASHGGGNTVEIVDYRDRIIERRYGLIDLSILFSRKNIFASMLVLINRFLTFPIRKQKKRAYLQFRSAYLKQSKKQFFSKEDFNTNDYDLYICGSDQIWHPTITGSLNPVYFLCFADKSRKIAYAPSADAGAFAYYAKNAGTLHEYIANLDALSVREQILSDELSKYTDKKIETVIDPVFLNDKSRYTNLVKDNGNRNYILVYHVAESGEMSRIARQAARETSKEVIEIHSNIKPFKGHKNYKQDLGPIEVLSYIYYADLIITNSFHGTAFSIIFKKNFYVVNNWSIRLKQLLENAGLTDRFAASASGINLDAQTDYAVVDSRLYPAIEKSREYLKDSIDNGNK